MDLKILDTSSAENAQVTKKNRLPGWRRIFFGVRTRILALYIVLMACSTLVSILAIRQVLLARLEEQVENFLTQEVKQFRRLTQGTNHNKTKPLARISHKQEKINLHNQKNRYFLIHD